MAPSASASAEPPECRDPRLLGDKERYKQLHGGTYMLCEDSWIPSYTTEQYGALIDMHDTLACEHHNFFLASQHPTASPAVKGWPAKYAMTAKMWRDSIHDFLEVLRPRLPESREHMIQYLYKSCSKMCLLEDTVPAFHTTWKECKGDLARYLYIQPSSFLLLHGRDSVRERCTDKLLDSSPWTTRVCSSVRRGWWRRSSIVC